MIGIGNDTNIIIKLGTSDVEIYLGSEKVYPNISHDYSLDYFTIEALENGYIYMDNRINSYEIALNDSLDVWNSTTFPDTNQIYLTTGDKLHIRCQGTPKVSETIDGNNNVIYNGIGTFNTTFRFKVYGNIMSLLYGGNFVGQTTFPSIDLYKTNDGTLVTQNYNKEYFLKLFRNNTNLVDARNLVLPATTLADSCYLQMFRECTSLVTAPELPATTLANSCYNNMFYGCTSLTTAPSELPATTLAERCYNLMFRDCTSLNYIKAMFTTTPGMNYTQNWVRNVAASGTFVKNSAATWTTTGNNGVPSGWTVQTATE